MHLGKIIQLHLGKLEKSEYYINFSQSGVGFTINLARLKLFYYPRSYTFSGLILNLQSKTWEISAISLGWKL